MAPKNKQQARHENFMYRLLIEILDNKYLANNVFFKGGTCAKMLGFLDRFSIDLDFDLSDNADKEKCREILYEIFNNLDFEIDDESKEALQFFLKYPAPEGERNTLKLEILDKVFKSNEYKPQHLKPIERTANCQTIETMFGNKLVAPIDRHEQGRGIASRDIYDIHYFFLNGHNYNTGIIKERRGKDTLDHLKELKNFIDDNLTQKIIDEDLNVLLDNDKFKKIRSNLKREVINFFREEIKSLK